MHLSVTISTRSDYEVSQNSFEHIMYVPKYHCALPKSQSKIVFFKQLILPELL